MTTACPGFASYELDSSGRVYVNGVLPEASGKELQNLQDAWKRYGGLVVSAANDYGIPPAWVMGVLMAESAGNPRACSPCAACNPSFCTTAAGQTCCAFGLMQFLASTAKHYGTSAAALLENPALAIDVGANLLADLIDKFGLDLPRVAASYNSGGARCGKEGTTFGLKTEGDYPMKVVKYANSATRLRAPVAGGALTGFVVAVACFGVAYKVYNK